MPLARAFLEKCAREFIGPPIGRRQMSNTSRLVRSHVRTVVVCGCKGQQESQIRSFFEHLGVKFIVMTDKELLRKRSLSPDLVVVTHFVGHKHIIHARAITNAPVRMVHGTTSAVADEIVAFFGLRGYAA